MKPKVNILQNDENSLNFELKNTNVSFANAIRRTIISDIPTVVFDEKNTTFHSNTTRLNNEILKQRLGCIPIFINDLTIPIEDYIVELSKKNETNSVQYLTTQDFMIQNVKNKKYLAATEVNKIFPPNKITGDYILFARLKPKITEDIPGEELNFSAKMTISTAKKNGMYNVAHTVSYFNSIDPVAQNQAWKTYLNELKKSEISQPQIDLEKMNWHNHKGKRYFLEDSFNFIIQTLGNYTNIELVSVACEIIIKKLKKIVEKPQEFIVQTSKTTIPYSYDIPLPNEDYTIGKIIEYMLFNNYYMQNNILSFVGFRKFHPHDKNGVIRIAFTKEAGTEHVFPIFQDVCNKAAVIYTEIKSQFQSKT